MASLPIISYARSRTLPTESPVESLDSVIRARQAGIDSAIKSPSSFTQGVQGLVQGIGEAQQIQMRNEQIESYDLQQQVQQQQLERQRIETQIQQMNLETRRVSEDNDLKRVEQDSRNNLQLSKRQEALLRDQDTVDGLLSSDDPEVRKQAFTSQFADFWSKDPKYEEEALRANWQHFSAQEREAYGGRVYSSAQASMLRSGRGTDLGKRVQSSYDAFENDAAYGVIRDQIARDTKNPNITTSEILSKMEFASPGQYTIDEDTGLVDRTKGVSSVPPDDLSHFEVIYKGKRYGTVPATTATLARKAITSGRESGLLNLTPDANDVEITPDVPKGPGSGINLGQFRKKQSLAVANEEDPNSPQNLATGEADVQAEGQVTKPNPVTGRARLSAIVPNSVKDFSTEPLVQGAIKDLTGLNSSELKAADVDTKELASLIYKQADFEAKAKEFNIADNADTTKDAVAIQSIKNKLGNAIAEKDFQRLKGTSPAIVDSYNDEAVNKHNELVDELNNKKAFDILTGGMYLNLKYGADAVITAAVSGKLNSPEELFYKRNLGLYQGKVSNVISQLETAATRVAGSEDRIGAATEEQATDLRKRMGFNRAPLRREPEGAPQSEIPSEQKKNIRTAKLSFSE